MRLLFLSAVFFLQRLHGASAGVSSSPSTSVSSTSSPFPVLSSTATFPPIKSLSQSACVSSTQSKSAFPSSISVSTRVSNSFRPTLTVSPFHSPTYSPTTTPSVYMCPPGEACGGPNLLVSVIVCPAGTFTSGWNSSVCKNCTAAPGWACAPASTNTWGVICPVFNYCPGGSSPAILCQVRDQCLTVGLSAPLVDGRATVYSISTLATGLKCPNFVTVERDGNILVSQACNHQVTRVISDSGVTTRVAGSVSGLSGFLNGPALASMLNNPMGIAAHPTTGNIFVVDNGNQVIRMISIDQVTTLTGIPGLCGTLDAEWNSTAGFFQNAPTLDNSNPQSLPYRILDRLFKCGFKYFLAQFIVFCSYCLHFFHSNSISVPFTF